MDDDSRVIPLAQLRGFRIANGAFDMRLWQVHSGDGRWIGNVDELLVDAATMEVRYLDVEVENLLATGRERHVLIPIDHARPDSERSSTVVVDGLAARAVARLPTYDRGTVVRGTDAEYVRPFVAARNAGSQEKLDLPLRAAPPRVCRPILVAALSVPTSRDDNHKAAVIAAGAEQSAEPAAATARRAGSRAA
ncbi:MAG TPA: PRC-barrel domain-containing protein [Longimicrobium sp.]